MLCCGVGWRFELFCGVLCWVVYSVWCCVICCAVGWGGVLNCSVEFRVALCTVLWCYDICCAVGWNGMHQ